jgi:hypothetical protein
MSDRTETIRVITTRFAWLAAGAVALGCQAETTTPTATENHVCATLSAKGAGIVKVPGKGVAVKIPSTLAVRGRMTAGPVVLEINRPKHGTLECRYEPSADSSAALVGCGPIAAEAGDVVATDQLTLKAGPAMGPLNDGTQVTACADVTAAPSEPPTELPPGFTRLPNGEIAPPDMSDGVPLEFGTVPFALTSDIEVEYRNSAAKDARVKQQLGARFAYSFVETIDPPKGKEPDSVHVRLWFFSHDANHGVIVTMKNGVIEAVEKSSKVPPEGREEVLAAVELARKDPMLSGKLGDLEGGAMLAQPATGKEPWIGNRVLDVRFYDATLVSKFMATVDLTLQTVLLAGPVQ